MSFELYKEPFTNESFQNRIKALANDTKMIQLTDISDEISFILDNFDQINEKEKQLEILDFLKIVADVKCDKTISTLLNFPIIDFLMAHFHSPLFEKEKEIFIEIIGSLIKNSNAYRSEDLLDFFLSQLYDFNPWNNQNTNLPYHFLYGIYHFFSENFFSEKFFQNHFFEKLCQLFNISTEIDVLLLQFSLICAKSVKFIPDVTSFIIFSIEFCNEKTSDLISYIIYRTYIRDPKILDNNLVKETIVRCISDKGNFVSQKYALKILSHLQENDIQFLNYSPIIIDSIFHILKISNNYDDDNDKLLFTIPVIYRTLQISLGLAESLFFDSKNRGDLTLFITEIILTNNYKIRNLGIKVFSQVIRNLPTKIYPFLTDPELQKIFYEILITVIDVDENEDSLIIFLTSIDTFLNILKNDEKLLFNFISLFGSCEILNHIEVLSNSENEELAATMQLISEDLSKLLDTLSSK